MCELILENKIANLANIQIDKEKYSKPGVWALYGQTPIEKWQCLEVAKTVNIYDEITSAIYILTTPDDDKCKKCSDVHPASRKFKEYSVGFNIHNCKKCSYTSKLRIKTWKRNPRYIDKYKDMLKQGYTVFKFICVDVSDNMEDDNKREMVEQHYATKHQALYWWDRKKIMFPHN